MRKKTIISGILASSVAIAATLGGCSLVSTNPSADMNQTIVAVDISKAEALDDSLQAYKEAVGTSYVIKRELVTYFVNVGSSYISQGYSYEAVFNMLLDALIENGVLVQYSTMYLLKEKATNPEAEGYDPDALETFVSKKTDKEKYEYLLGEDSDDVKIATYSLYHTINAAIDSREQDILDEEESSSGTETRTTPSGVDTQVDDYYPKKEGSGELDYGIYTGHKGYTLDDSGAYKEDKLDGTRPETRIRAYNDFIDRLTASSYNLIDKKTENLRDVNSLRYIQDEYVTQLKQRTISKYYDLYEEQQEKLLQNTDENSAEAYAYVDAVYKEMLNLQKETYKEESGFTSAYGNLSDSSFVLYAPEAEDGGRYGFVYNILLPFSAPQSATLSALKSRYADSELDGGYKPAYYLERNKLLENITSYDQRGAWFNGATDYSFKPADGFDYFGKDAGREYLFFENNIVNSGENGQYEQIAKYDGRYSYNGTVVENKNGYTLTPNPIKIDGMLDEFVAYIDYVLGNAAGTTEYEKTNVTLTEDNLYKAEEVDGKKKINYENFVYATGSVDFGGATEADNRANIFKKTADGQTASKQYLALSAANELQYAYTTDTGVLSQYIGYNVDAGDTNYVKEFEYASHAAVKNGAGSFAVCSADYGWHLIYVTYTFDAGEQFTPDWQNNINVEGTFENIFYEWIKNNDLSDITSTRRSQLITAFNIDSTVTKYQERYQNLLDMDKNR